MPLNGAQVILWALVAGLVIVIEGLAVSIALIFIQSARNTGRSSASYRSRSHE